MSGQSVFLDIPCLRYLRPRQLGRGGGQVVSVSSSTPLIPTGSNLKFVFEKNKNKQKEAGIGP